jgi:hypothetical protein
MSYIQITIGGKERGLKFNQLAIELMSQYNDTNTTTGFIYALFYAGLRGNNYVKREEPDYTFEEVCDWVDEMDNKDKIVNDVSAVLTETQVWKKLVKQGEEINEEEKKKVLQSSVTII